MKKFQIFKPGKHISNAGVALEFTEEQLRDSIAAYDPALHQAPITIGHPRDNLPAYGWIGALSFDESEKTVDAEPVQLHDEFVSMVKDGRFTKRSASWYLPDAATNPTPGKLYLRHVAFLGAQAPAVKGLRSVEFNDDETGTVEFSDSFDTSTIAGLFRNLREWLIGDKGAEVADRVIPNYSVTSLETSAQRAASEETSALPAFTEEETNEMTITKEQLDAAVAAARTEAEAATKKEIDAIRSEAKATADKQAAEFAEKDKAVQSVIDKLAANDKAAKRALLSGEIDKLAEVGKVLPAQRDAVIAFAETLDGEKADSIEFGEGDKAKKYSQRAFFMELLSQSPVAVEYKELSEASDFAEGRGGISAEVVARKAQELQDKARAEGRSMTISQAVFEVSKVRAA